MTEYGANKLHLLEHPDIYVSPSDLQLSVLKILSHILSPGRNLKEGTSQIDNRPHSLFGFLKLTPSAAFDPGELSFRKTMVSAYIIP